MELQNIEIHTQDCDVEVAHKINSIEDLIIQLKLDKCNALFYLTNNPA